MSGHLQSAEELVSSDQDTTSTRTLVAGSWRSCYTCYRDLSMETGHFHHLSYEYEQGVMLCVQCHNTVHSGADMYDRLKPVDDSYYNGRVHVSQGAKERLEYLKTQYDKQNLGEINKCDILVQGMEKWAEDTLEDEDE